jgi:hypothetical protein
MSEDQTSKFIKVDEISRLLEHIISEESKTLSVDYPVSVFDPATVTECPRRMIYRANGCKSEMQADYHCMQSMLFTKQKWIDYFKRSRKIKLVDKFIVTADCHYNVSGNADAVIKMGERLYVVKVQPICSEDFYRIKERGAAKKHIVESLVYMWLTEIHDGLLLYENQDTNECNVFHVRMYEPVIRSVMKKCLGLMENKVQGTIPERAYKHKGSNECQECEFINKCWEEKSNV